MSLDQLLSVSPAYKSRALRDMRDGQDPGAADPESSSEDDASLHSEDDGQDNDAEDPPRGSGDKYEA